MPCTDTSTRRHERPIARRLAAAAALLTAIALLAFAVAPGAQAQGVEGSGEAGAGAPTEAATTPTETSSGSPPETLASPPPETTVAPPREPREPRAPRQPRAPRERVTRSADRHPTNAGGCHITIGVAPRRLTAGEAAGVSGALVCADSSAAAAQAVTVYEHVAGTPGYDLVGTVTSDDDGSYQLSTGPLDTNGAFYAASHGVRSTRRAVKVAPRVSLAGPPDGAQLLVAGRHLGAGARSTNTVTFTGTVSPDDTGAQVVLQRDGSADGDWRRIGLGQVGEDGRYSISHSFGKPGGVSVRVVVRARGRNLVGVSEPLSYEISQRQNPRLTVQSQADPIVYGQQVTISGIAAGSANEPVSLFARVRGGAYAEVAKATTEADGSYSMPAQSPVQNTAYRVQTADQTSAVLFEGVRSIVNVQVSADSILSGGLLTFSGTLTPSHDGQIVYLQRQLPSGVGFHTVETATIGPDSSFSLDHNVFALGTQVFRIKVPGGPSSQTAASGLVSVQVTAAAAPVVQEAPEA